MIGIYKITSPTGKVYIGQSVNINNRFASYKRLDPKNKNLVKLWRSLNKYGADNHQFDVIELCCVDELNTKERYWQDFYDVLNVGLNCVLQKTDEKRKVLSESTKDKLRKWNLENPRLISEEEKLKTSIRLKGNTYGKRVWTDEQKAKVRASLKKLWENGCRSNSASYNKGSDNVNSKLILDFKTGIFYYGVREASEFYGVAFSSLKKMMCGNRKNTTSLKYV